MSSSGQINRLRTSLNPYSAQAVQSRAAIEPSGRKTNRDTLGPEQIDHPQVGRDNFSQALPSPVQSLIAIPTALSGPITIALIVVLGIFVYPWLLGRRHGRIVVSLATLLLAALFMAFEAGNEGATATAIALAGLLGLAPVVAGAIVARLQRRAGP